MKAVRRSSLRRRGYAQPQSDGWNDLATLSADAGATPTVRWKSQRAYTSGEACACKGVVSAPQLTYLRWRQQRA